MKDVSLSKFKFLSSWNSILKISISFKLKKLHQRKFQFSRTLKFSWKSKTSHFKAWLLKFQKLRKRICSTSNESRNRTRVNSRADKIVGNCHEWISFFSQLLTQMEQEKQKNNFRFDINKLLLSVAVVVFLFLNRKINIYFLNVSGEGNSYPIKFYPKMLSFLVIAHFYQTQHQIFFWNSLKNFG